MINFKNLAVTALLLLIVGCSNQTFVGMANPASVYCEEVGGKHILKEGTGYCELPGRTVEEWDLYQAKDRFNRP